MGTGDREQKSQIRAATERERCCYSSLFPSLFPLGVSVAEICSRRPMAETPVTAYLSLGSNLGDRLENLRLACRGLEGETIRLRRVSSIYETEPVDFVEQDWFLNCVVEIETTLPPLTLLEMLQRIEDQLGRRRERPKGPRTIDIDILLYGDCTIRTERLFVPHPRMLHRRFVLEPLREIAASVPVPPDNKTVDERFQELQDPSQVRRIEAGVRC